MLKRWCGNVYSTSERNYQTFNKIQAKSSFGRHVGGQEYALQNVVCYTAVFRVVTQRCVTTLKTAVYMAANKNHITLLKGQSTIKYLP